MKIIILQGSPNKNGSTAMLSEEFTRGAKEAGHNIERIDIVEKKINPCIGCVACDYEGPCVQKDENEEVRAKILGADMVVFATPLYYYGMTAQLKIVIDRFCAYNSSINRKHMKSVLLAVAWNNDDWTFNALESHYQTLVNYLNFRNQGMVLGRGCGSPTMTRGSRFMNEAYELGKRL